MRLLLAAALLAASTLAATPAYAQLTFADATLEEALAQASASGGGVLLDVYATWCGPCQRLDEEVFLTTLAGEAAAGVGGDQGRRRGGRGPGHRGALPRRRLPHGARARRGGQRGGPRLRLLARRRVRVDAALVPRRQRHDHRAAAAVEAEPGDLERVLELAERLAVRGEIDDARPHLDRAGSPKTRTTRWGCAAARITSSASTCTCGAEGELRAGRGRVRRRARLVPWRPGGDVVPHPARHRADARGPDGGRARELRGSHRRRAGRAASTTRSRGRSIASAPRWRPRSPSRGAASPFSRTTPHCGIRAEVQFANGDAEGARASIEEALRFEPDSAYYAAARTLQRTIGQPRSERRFKSAERAMDALVHCALAPIVRASTRRSR